MPETRLTNALSGKRKHGGSVETENLNTNPLNKMPRIPKKSSPLSFQEAVEKGLSDPDRTTAKFAQTYLYGFDPEGDGYDHKRAAELMEKYPLTIPKPEGRPAKGESWSRRNPEAFSSWEWHDKSEGYKEEGWFEHGASRDFETGRILKGRKHDTYDKTVQGEGDAGYEIYLGEDGRYYSRKKSESK